MEAGMRNPEIVAEILRRAEILRFRKLLRVRRLSAVLSVGVSVIAITLLIRLLPLVRSDEAIAPALGSTELYFNGSVAGGYVLTGIICFTLGVAVTLLCIRAKERKTILNCTISHSRDTPCRNDRDNNKSNNV